MVQISVLTGIATYRERQIDKPDICDHEEIDIQIKKLQDLLKRNKEQINDPDITIPDEVRVRSQIDAKVLTKLGMKS